LGLSFFGFFSSRLLRCWPFAMSLLLDSRQWRSVTGRVRELVAARFRERRLVRACRRYIRGRLGEQGPCLDQGLDQEASCS
jgi:hypothetical protein